MAIARPIPDFHDHERFFSKIKVNEETGCWEWQAFIQEKGYAMFSVKGTMYRAHRVSYLIHFGQPDIELEVDHTCMVRHCVSPHHLRLVTHKVNTTENSNGLTAINKRKTHCKRGHEFNEENTLLRASDGGRNCRICIKLINSSRYLERTEGKVIRRNSKKCK